MGLDYLKDTSKFMKHQRYILIALLSFVFYSSYSQVKPETLGGWYMYFWNTNIKKSDWGFQGDIQYRNWNVAGDLEQLLLRGGLCYSPKESSTKLTLGYAFILSDVFGLQQSKISQEHRIYQEASSSNHWVSGFTSITALDLSNGWFNIKNSECVCATICLSILP